MSHVCYTSPLISASHSLVQLNFANKYDYCTYNLILNSLWFQGVNFVLQGEVVAASKKNDCRSLSHIYQLSSQNYLPVLLTCGKWQVV